MSELVLWNRQRLRRINAPLLRRIVRRLLEEFVGFEDYGLCIHLVAAPEMVRLNETFLRHAGTTDVITFDYAAGRTSRLSASLGLKTIRAGHDAYPALQGEIFVCVDEAIRQARRFRTSWQAELGRYVVHGVLHLCGYDDRRAASRRKMKREENRLLRLLTARFPLSHLGCKPTLRA